MGRTKKKENQTNPTTISSQRSCLNGTITKSKKTPIPRIRVSMVAAQATRSQNSVEKYVNSIWFEVNLSQLQHMQQLSLQNAYFIRFSIFLVL
jgi:hypothetical protein